MYALLYSGESYVFRYPFYLRCRRCPIRSFFVFRYL